MNKLFIIFLLSCAIVNSTSAQIVDLGETYGLVIPIVDTATVDNPTPGQMVLMPTAFPIDSTCPPHCGYTMFTFNGDTWFDMSQVKGLVLDEWALSDDVENGLVIKHKASGYTGLQLIPGEGDTMSVVLGGPGNSVFEEEESRSSKSFLFGPPGATVSGGSNNKATNNHATVSGGKFNYARGVYSNISGGRLNDANGDYSTVGGGYYNIADRDYSTVSGGDRNEANGVYSNISGGKLNFATGAYATVSGGDDNQANGDYSTVSGGDDNEANGDYSTVSGGYANRANGCNSFAAGDGASAKHDYSFVWNGEIDTAYVVVYPRFESTGIEQFLINAPGGVGIGTNAPTNQLTVLGTIEINGTNNGIKFPDSTVQKTAATSGWHLTGNGGTGGAGILGTTDNVPFSIHTNNLRSYKFVPPTANTDAPSLIGGYKDNEVLAQGGTISGGGSQDGKNSIIGNYGTIGGGLDNRAALRSVVGGGSSNIADGQDASISGGNSNAASASYSSVGGGLQNTASGLSATVGGGQQNKAEQQNTTVGGGADNKALSMNATIAGGNNNIASGPNSTISGGNNNRASGDGATIPGGNGNKAEGFNSFAAGTRAVARHNNSFVWNDGNGSQTDSLFTSENSQFLVKASNGAKFISDTLCIEGMLKISILGNGIMFPDSTVQTTAAIGGGGGSGWSFTGDAINPGEFLGTTNNEPLEFKVNGLTGFRLLSTLSGGNTPNVLGGDASNSINSAGTFGATVAGGTQNTADTIATVGGGDGNTASGYGATVSGGIQNVASGRSGNSTRWCNKYSFW